jgi:hypothetical protein
MGLTIRRYACMGIHTNTYSAHGCPFNDQQESVKKKELFYADTGKNKVGR